MAITLRQPAHMAALSTRRVHNPGRASQLVLAGLISVVAAPWALFWQSDRADEPGQHRLH